MLFCQNFLMSSEIYIFLNGTFLEAEVPITNKQNKKEDWIGTQFWPGPMAWIGDVASCIILSLPQEGLRIAFGDWWSFQNCLIMFLALDETMKTWAQWETLYWSGDVAKSVLGILESPMQKTEARSMYLFIRFNKA